MIQKPKIFIIAETKAIQSGIDAYLAEIGAPEWTTDALDDHSKISEVGGRLCYKAFGTELNANITRTREGNMPYLGNVINVGHGSIFEHSTVSFIFHNVTRVFTHELVRHRAGGAYSQESLRFVALDDLDHYQPDDPTYPDLTPYMLQLSEWQAKLRKKMITDDMPFSERKKITSFLRRIAPMGLCTSIMATFNHRTIRHIIKMRTETAAEIEIRDVFLDVGHQMKARYPAIYQDMNLDDDGQWIFDSPKI